VTDKYLEQDELDRLITRELSRLPCFAPSRGFQGRVMAQVRLPEPRALVVVPEADHFFGGKLEALQDAIATWAAARPWRAA